MTPRLDLEALQNAVHPGKDAEGVNPSNIGNIVYGKSRLGPCTSLAAVEHQKQQHESAMRR